MAGLRNWCLINATDTLVRSIWLCILSTYIFHRFIMEIPPLRLSTDRQDLFLPKKTKLKQSWHLVKDIRHSSWEVLRIRKLLPNVFSWCCFSANCSAENTASKHALSSTQIAVFNSPLVPTVGKFGITILVEYFIVLLFKDASVSL